MESCIYAGRVSHRRHLPTPHGFGYEVFMVYLDLAELPELFDVHPLWSARRPAPGWFRRADYLEPTHLPLDVAVRELVQERTGVRPRGPIRLLTNLRMFGYVINPVSFYYCFDAAGEHVEHLVAEVTNTPWRERHAYVSAGLTSDHAKALHVSPFMAMAQRYTWRAGLPAERLDVSIALHEEGRRMFDATLQLTRRELTRAELSRRLWRHPPMTLKVLAGIYGQAIRLRLKGLRPYPHPDRAVPPAHKPAGRSRAC